MPNNEYDVNVNRSVRLTTTVKVTAANREKAEEQALKFVAEELQLDDWEQGDVLETLVESVELVSEATSSALPDELQSFWKTSDTVVDFISEHCVGERPASVVRREDGSLLLSDGDRTAFALVSANNGSYLVSSATDPVSFFDPEAELAEVGRYDDATEAFQAAAETIGIDLSSRPSPR